MHAQSAEVCNAVPGESISMWCNRSKNNFSHKLASNNSATSVDLTFQFKKELTNSWCNPACALLCVTVAYILTVKLITVKKTKTYNVIFEFQVSKLFF